jgi:hypothetical protein
MFIAHPWQYVSFCSIHVLTPFGNLSSDWCAIPAAATSAFVIAVTAADAVNTSTVSSAESNMVRHREATALAA